MWKRHFVFCKWDGGPGLYIFLLVLRLSLVEDFSFLYFTQKFSSDMSENNVQFWTTDMVQILIIIIGNKFCDNTYANVYKEIIFCNYNSICSLNPELNNTCSHFDHSFLKNPFLPKSQNVLPFQIYFQIYIRQKGTFKFTKLTD